jgi:hypothetical protein
MKSLPYKEQLERYTQKAFEEWCTGEIIRKEAKKCQNNNEFVSKGGITFILLSLMKPNLDKYTFTKNKPFQRSKYKLTLTGEWVYKTYQELLVSLNNYCKKFKEELDKLIVDDYCEFVSSLCELANNYWIIRSNESYRLQIFPWELDNIKDAEGKRKEIKEYQHLRIHDIHEKLLYDQLLSMLEHELEIEGYRDRVRRLSRESFQEQIDTEEKEKVRLFTNSSYAHGVGIFEVQYILSKSFRPEKKELFKLIIQVQGDRYCHMVVYDNIVDAKNKSINMTVLNSAWEDNLKPQQGTIDKYISLPNSNDTDTVLEIKLNNKFGKYGENLIYQYAEIPPTATVQNVIDAIVNDINKITEWFK